MNDDPEIVSLIDEIEEMYSWLLENDITLKSHRLHSSKLVRNLIRLSAKSTTSQLWLQYQRMIRTSRVLIKADCTGSWLNHLCVVSDGLPMSAAT